MFENEMVCRTEAVWGVGCPGPIPCYRGRLSLLYYPLIIILVDITHQHSQHSTQSNKVQDQNVTKGHQVILKSSYNLNVRVKMMNMKQRMYLIK